MEKTTNTKRDILSIIAELVSVRRILVFLFIMNEPIDEHQNAEMLKCFVNQIVFQSPNITQVTSAIKFSQ